MIYLSRTWTVKPGREDEFLGPWRDTRNRGRFQSVGGPVASEAELDALAEVLESVEVTSYELLVER